MAEGHFQRRGNPGKKIRRSDTRVALMCAHGCISQLVSIISNLRGVFDVRTMTSGSSALRYL